MSTNNTKISPQFPFYRDKQSGDVHPALTTPRGYEDNHPELYTGLESYTPGAPDPDRDEIQKDLAADSLDRSGYVAPVMVNTPIATAADPLPAPSMIYAQPGTSIPGNAEGRIPGEVVVGLADRDQTRVSGEAPAPVTGTVNPADVGAAQIEAAQAAAAALQAQTQAAANASLQAQQTKDSGNVPPPKDSETGLPEDLNDLTVPALKDELDKRNIAYASTDLKADLVEKLEGATAKE